MRICPNLFVKHTAKLKQYNLILKVEVEKVKGNSNFKRIPSLPYTHVFISSNKINLENQEHFKEIKVTSSKDNHISLH